MQEGVYDLHWGSRLVRIIVLSEIPQSEHNALWLLFSGVAEHVRFGRAHYEPRQPELSPVLNKLLVAYNLEGIAMPYTVEDFKREVKREYLAMLTPEELSEIMRPEEIINRLPAEERLKGLPAEERLKGLPAEERLKGLPAEERLKGLTKKQIEAYLKKFSAQSRGRKRNA